MNEHSKHNNNSPETQNDMDVLGLLKKMQQQLVYLEKKLDTLIAQRPQSQDRPFQKSFSRPPFRPHSRPGHSGPSDGNRSDGRSDARPGGFHKKKHFFKRPDR